MAIQVKKNFSRDVQLMYRMATEIKSIKVTIGYVKDKNTPPTLLEVLYKGLSLSILNIAEQHKDLTDSTKIALVGVIEPDTMREFRNAIAHRYATIPLDKQLATGMKLCSESNVNTLYTRLKYCKANKK